MIKTRDFPKVRLILKFIILALTPVISRLLIVNTMLPTRQKRDRRYWNGQVSFQIRWLSRDLIMPDTNILIFLFEQPSVSPTE